MLEVLFVLIVAMAFAVGLYRQYTAVSIEKTIAKLNNQLAAVIKLANTFYFSVDPTTRQHGSKPIRFCNQDKYFNTAYSLTKVASLICPQSSSKSCNIVHELANGVTQAASAAKQQYTIIIGQQDRSEPKFVAIILQSTDSTDSGQTIVNPQLFALFKGKLAGTPRYVDKGESPFNGYPKTLKQGGVLWIIPPSQGDTSLFSGEKLSNAYLQAFNDLANQWQPDPPETEGYTKACQTPITAN